MAIDSFKVGTGHNAASLTNIEDLLGEGNAPQVVDEGAASLFGSVRVTTLDGKVHDDGWTLHTWVFDALLQSEFNTLIAAVFGDLYTSSANVTIQTLTEVGVYSTYNAVAVRPRVREDYTAANGWVRGLRLRFNNLEGIGGFSDGFSLGFDV